jgi:hypothetical protein
MDKNLDKRRSVRYGSVAGIRINEKGFEGEALLTDISDHGFCMESKTYVALVPEERYLIQITPEDAPGIGTFELHVEVRWARSTAPLFMAGFAIIGVTANHALQRYVDYLKLHNTRALL